MIQLLVFMESISKTEMQGLSFPFVFFFFSYCHKFPRNQNKFYLFNSRSQ
uniref:Uncharacterized protein n=1 Tax=Rhizophora mucronata TaxID=61149 RepID=A0A2P2P136_RHIMU